QWPQRDADLAVALERHCGRASRRGAVHAARSHEVLGEQAGDRPRIACFQRRLQFADRFAQRLLQRRRAASGHAEDDHEQAGNAVQWMAHGSESCQSPGPMGVAVHAAPGPPCRGPLTMLQSVHTSWYCSWSFSMTLARPWLEQYPEGVPHAIDPDEFPSVVAVLQSAIELYRDRPAFQN